MSDSVVILIALLVAAGILLAASAMAASRHAPRSATVRRMGIDAQVYCPVTGAMTGATLAVHPVEPRIIVAQCDRFGNEIVTCAQSCVAVPVET